MNIRKIPKLSELFSESLKLCSCLLGDKCSSSIESNTGVASVFKFSSPALSTFWKNLAARFVYFRLVLPNVEPPTVVAELH